MAAGEERDVRAIPVAAHEVFQVMLVPGLLLRVQNSLHRSAHVLRRIFLSENTEGGCDQNGGREERQKSPHRSSEKATQCRIIRLACADQSRTERDSFS